MTSNRIFYMIHDGTLNTEEKFHQKVIKQQNGSH